MRGLAACISSLVGMQAVARALAEELIAGIRDRTQGLFAPRRAPTDCRHLPCRELEGFCKNHPSSQGRSHTPTSIRSATLGAQIGRLPDLPADVTQVGRNMCKALDRRLR